MSHMNDFDSFNFGGIDETSSGYQKNQVSGETQGEKKNSGVGNINDDLDSFHHFEENFGGERGKSIQFDKSFNIQVNDNQMNDSLKNLYVDSYVHKRESEENIIESDYTKESNSIMNNVKNQDFHKNEMNTRKDSKQQSFDITGEHFFDKESDLSESEEANVWEFERLKRIEERKEYEIKKKKEIKEKAAEDLKKWYEEMAIKIEEKKKLFNEQKLEEEKKKKENLENKTWVKVSQYLDFEKGEYFKEDSRIKQILLKLIKQENS